MVWSVAKHILMGSTLASVAAAITAAGRLPAGPSNPRCPGRQTSGSVNKETKLKFKNVAMGEMADQDATKLGFRTHGDQGVRLGFTSFQASDGVRLTLTNAQFASSSEAQEYFGVIVGRSAKVLKSTTSRDDHGHAIRLEAQVVVQENVNGKTEYGVFWTSGGRFQEITSSSLKDALALQREVG